MQTAVSNDKLTGFMFFYPFFKLTVTCRLYVIYVREDDDFNV